MKKQIIFFASLLTIAFVIGAVPVSVEVRHMEAQYAADFSDDRVLVGASHNIFVGKVIGQTGTKERGVGPETQFEVAVVDNIKGSLRGSVIVNQEGGMKDGVLYVTAEGKRQQREYLLQPGASYLFLTRYNKMEGWHTVNFYPTATKLLTKESMDTDHLRSLAAADPRIGELRAAYQNEILLEADVRNDNALNSYKSMQEKPVNELR